MFFLYHLVTVIWFKIHRFRISSSISLHWGIFHRFCLLLYNEINKLLSTINRILQNDNESVLSVKGEPLSVTLDKKRQLSGAPWHERRAAFFLEQPFSARGRITSFFESFDWRTVNKLMPILFNFCYQKNWNLCLASLSTFV